MRAAWKATVGPRETRSGRERMRYTQEGLRLTFASWKASAEGKEGFWMAAVSGLNRGFASLKNLAGTTENLAGFPARSGLSGEIANPLLKLESHAEASSSSTPTTCT